VRTTLLHLPEDLLGEELGFGAFVVGVDLVLVVVHAQVLVVVGHAEGHAAAVMLHVEPRVVLVVLVREVDYVVRREEREREDRERERK
jgi:hypothetical protein